MDTTRTDLCIEHLDDFDVVSTETVTRTRNLDVKINTDDGNAILVPLATLKFYLDRRRRGNDVRAVDPALERWVDRHNRRHRGTPCLLSCRKTELWRLRRNRGLAHARSRQHGRHAAGLKGLLHVRGQDERVVRMLPAVRATVCRHIQPSEHR